MSRREGWVAAIVALLAITLIPLVGGSVLWTRPLWVDELCCVSYVVGGADSPAEVVRRVARSWDYAPPLLHLIVWPVVRVAGGEVTPVLLRSISLAAVSVALLFTYATLRRRFAPFPSAAGVLAVAGHSLVITHAFDGRFYGPWLLLAAGYAWSLGLETQRRSDVAQGVFSILLVAIHWFGIISLTLMSAAAIAVTPGPWRVRLRSVASSVAGFATVAALAPLAIAQRSGATGHFWIAELNGGQIVALAKLFWIAAVPVAALVVLLGRAARNAPTVPPMRAAFRDPSLAALLSLAAMPVGLVLVSVVLHPSMLDRYAIVAVLAWAPLVALALTSLNLMARAAALGGLFLLLILTGSRSISARQEFAADVTAGMTAFEEGRSRALPVVFWGLHSVYRVAPPVPPSPGVPAGARYLDLSDSAFVALFPGDAMEPVRKKYRSDRDLARGHARTYGFPVLATPAQLDSMPRFLLLAGELSLPGGYKRPEVFGRALFPRHRVSRVGDMLSLFERESP